MRPVLAVSVVAVMVSALAGCLSARGIGVAVGTAVGAGVGAALGGCPTREPGQPPPDGGRRLTTTGGAAVGGVVGGAAGYLAGALLQQQDEGRLYETRRVLAAIALAPQEAMAAVAAALALGRGLVVERVAPLASTGVGLVIFRIVDGGSVTAKVRSLSADPRVRLAQPDYIYQVAACQQATQGQTFTDGVRQIRADRLRAAVTGRGIAVALIDTGMDIGHPAFPTAVADTIDLTGEGFTADVHGTMVAGVMASRHAGVAPDIRVVAIKACRPERPAERTARCPTSLLALGVDLANARATPVINMSVAGPNDPMLRLVIGAAVRSGRLVVAAAGNGGARARPAYPGAFEDVIAVTAVDLAERVFRGANRGDYIDVAAPGVDVTTLAPDNGMVIASGTSLAAGFVSATLALLLESGSGRAPLTLRAVLEETARDLGTPGRDRQYGRGLIDACRAVERLRGPLAECIDRR